MPRQSEENRLLNKRLSEKRRREKIKMNAELHGLVKKQARARYYNRKAEGIVIPINEMTSLQKRQVRKQNRVRSRLYRQRKKERENALEEDLVLRGKPILCCDPLSSPPTSPIQEGKPLSSELLNNVSPTSRPHTRLSTQQVIKSDEDTLSTDLVRSITPFVSQCKTEKPDFTDDSFKQIVVNIPEDMSAGPSTLTAQNVIVEYSPLADDNISTCSSRPISPVNSFCSDDSSTKRPAFRNKARTSVKINATGTNKIKSRLKLNFAKLEYNAVEDNKRLHKRIKELKVLNCKYRKRLSRMRKKMLEMNSKDGMDIQAQIQKPNRKKVRKHEIKRPKKL